MDFQAIIARRRDGERHTREELDALAQGAANGSIPDYQLAAWLMAAYLNPLNDEETVWLTLAMANSGERLDLTGLPKPWLDKHSTGGVGDKTSLVVLPILAACGLTVVKMSGRGLGITGGTIDKLESIPGFRTDLSPAEMKEQAAKIGLAITGATPDLAPADKVLYGLRDTTGTVASLPLIVSSILSKKIAGGAETVVLDVKCGSGAFMRTLPEARLLSEALARVAESAGLKCRTAITDMDQPLGSAVGNALEVAEALRVLWPLDPIARVEAYRGTVREELVEKTIEGLKRFGEMNAPLPLPPPTIRFRRLCIGLAGIAIHASGFVDSDEAGRNMAKEALESGRAAAKFSQWIRAQGGTSVEGVMSAARAANCHRQTAHDGSAGWIQAIHAETVGEVVVDLGGGRKQKSDVIDHSVGIELHVCVGSKVEPNQPLFTVHSKDEEGIRMATQRLREAIQFSKDEVAERPLFL